MTDMDPGMYDFETEQRKAKAKKAKKQISPDFTFQHWLKEECEVCCVFEVATGISFPRRGELWTGLYSELVAIKQMMLRNSNQKLGFYMNLWLESKRREVQ